MHRKGLMKKIKIIIPFIFLFLTVISSYGRSLDDIKKSGVIYAAFTESSRNSINYKIALEFAKFLNVKLVPVITSWDENFSLNGVRPADLETNPKYHYTPDALQKADFICGTIYVYKWRKKIFDYAGIMQVSDLLVIKKTQQDWNYFIKRLIPEKYLDNITIPRIRTYKDLIGKKIALLKNSSYQKNMAAINKKLGGGIKIIYTSSEEESQRLMLTGQVDGFVAVSYLALKFINEHSANSKLAFPVGRPFDVGWAVQNGNKGLATEINNFYATIKGDGTLNKLFRDAYGIDYKTYVAIINSFSENEESTYRSYDDIVSSGKLIVALRNREMIYKENGKKQFSQNLAEALANYMQLELEIKIVPNLSDYFTASDGKIHKDSAYTPEFFKNVDVACDLLAPVPWRLSKLDIIGYMPNAIVVVGNKNRKISTVADLKKLRGVTAKGSSYEQALINNHITNYFYAPANDMLDLVDKGKADYTLVSISIYSLPNYPNLEAKFILGEIQSAGWAIKKNHPKLRQKILEFFDYAKKVGLLDDYFKQQTGMPFKAAEKFLIALHQTYNIGVFPFVFYGSDQGLPQENITSIFQDNSGYIWFGTLSGAVKYNGRQMQNFTTKDGMISNDIMDIAQDSNNVIYFATLSGISSYINGKIDTVIQNEPFKHILVDSKNNKLFYGDEGISILTNKHRLLNLNAILDTTITNVHSIAQIPDENKYFVGTKDGIYLLNLDNYTLKKVSNLTTYYIFIDTDEKTWISTPQGIFHSDVYSLKEGDVGIKINKKLNIKSNIQKITQTNDGAIWLIGDFKAYQIFSLNLSPIVYDESIGLSGQKILSFLVDNEENLWFGFYGGVQKLSNRSLRVIYPHKLNYYVNTMLQDSYNHLWLGFNNKLYLLSDSLINLGKRYAKTNSSFAISRYPNSDKILVASTKGIFLINPKTLNIVKRNIFNNKLFSIKNIFVDKKGEIFISTGYNGIVYYLKKFSSKPKYIENSSTTFIQDFIQIDTTIIATNKSGLVYFDGKTFKPYIKTNFSTITIKKINNIIYVGCENGLYKLKNKKLIPIKIKNLSNKSITAISKANDPNHIWLGTYNGLNYVGTKRWITEFTVDAQDGLPGNEISVNGLMLDAKGMLWLGTLHGIATYDIKKKSLVKYAPDCRIEKILLNGEPVKSLPPTLKYNQNNFIFELSGLSFKNEQSIVYDYYLRGNNKIYESSSGVPHKAAYQNLPPGNYSFLYRAKGKDGIWSYYKKLDFEILSPIWQRWWFISIMFILLVAIVYIIIKLREKALKAKNEELERLVRERTKEIEKQKEAIEAKNFELEQQQEEIIVQRDEIAKQRDIAEKHRDALAKQQEEIMDSIYYAKRIQAAILPPNNYLKSFLSEFFILYMPRDIVSGDFYWIKKIGDEIVVVAADCTGHGVPGAFMSMLGSALLDEIILRKTKELTTGEILDALRDGIVNALHQTGKVEEAKDGMDMALYIINPKKHSLQFSGAFNPLYIIRGEEIIELKADRKPIGIFETVETSFSTHNFTPQKGDIIYSFSDGYASQFGGPNGKKFRLSRFKKLFLTIKDRSMQEQNVILQKTLKNWMGVKYEQVDDILVIGVKYTWD